MEQEIAEDKLLKRKLGDTLEWVVDALLQDEDTLDLDKVKSIKDRKCEALEALAYVRDVLKGRTTINDEDRSLEAEESSKRKARPKDLVTTDETLQTRRNIAPAASPATSLVTQRSRMPNMSGSQESLPVPPSNKTTLTPFINGRYYLLQSLCSPRATRNDTKTGFSDVKSNVATISRPPASNSSAPIAPSTYPPPGAGLFQEPPSRKVQRDPLGAMSY
jgi:TBC1 domain family member 5